MSISSALKGVREEVETIILGMTPTRMVSQRASFSIHTNNEKKDIEKMTGSSRLFYVGEGVSDNNPYSTGHTTKHDTVVMPITFVYQTGQAWREAALDDMGNIVQQLLVTPSTVAGVAHRSVPPGQANKTITQSEDTGWEYHTLMLIVYLSV